MKIAVTKLDLPQYQVVLGSELFNLQPDEARELMEGLADFLCYSDVQGRDQLKTAEPGYDTHTNGLAQVLNLTEFSYDGIGRRGYVVGATTGTDGLVNLDVLETWNSRDIHAELDYEATFKTFKAHRIQDARRLPRG